MLHIDMPGEDSVLSYERGKINLPREAQKEGEREQDASRMYTGGLTKLDCKTLTINTMSRVKKHQKLEQQRDPGPKDSQGSQAGARPMTGGQSAPCATMKTQVQSPSPHVSVQA